MALRFSSDWFTGNIPIWTEHLARFRGKPSLQFLEIGSFEGRSACWLLQNILTNPSSKLTCIDLFPSKGQVSEEHRDIFIHSPTLRDAIPKNVSSEENFDHNIKALHAEHRVIKCKGDSKYVLRTLPSRTYHCIYIDGSHRAPNVLRDMILCWDLLTDDGVMVLDDYLWQMFLDQPLKNPRMGIDAFLNVFQGQYTILHQEYQILLQKK